MKHVLALLAIVCPAVTAVGIAHAAAGGDNYPIIDFQLPGTGQAINPLPYHFYGVTLGADWQGFPANLTPDYNLDGGTNVLDVTLPVYIDWEMHVTLAAGGGCPSATPQSVFPPRPLANEPWFAGNHSQLLVWEKRQILSDVEYHTCQAGQGLDLPEISDLSGPGPFTADGKLRVMDRHGGIGNETIVWGFRPVTDQIGRYLAFHIFIFRWNKVNSYTDDATGILVDATPGTAFRKDFGFRAQNSVGAFCEYNMRSSVLALQWPSSDIAGTSERFTDSADMAVLNSHLDESVVWGFDSQGGQANRNYHCNIAPFGSSSLFIDGSDFAVMAAKLGVNHCNPSKATTPEAIANERDAILTWFGIAATGGMIEVGPNGETLPEYAIVDPEQNRRAIQDPYGYQKVNPAKMVEKIPWGHVKQLYR